MKAKLQIPVFLGLIFVLIVSGVQTTPVQAASFSVGTAAELIAAINTANGNSADDVITLTADITLDAVDHISTGANNLPAGATGLPSITSKITIMGNGYTIQRDLSYSSCPHTPNNPQDFRIFYVTTSGDLTLSNLTIRNGCTSYSSSGESGGGVYVFGGKLSINNTNFLENTAENYGGAISSNGGTITISNAYFSKNKAFRGGGIGTHATTITSIANSVFSENSATHSNPLAEGGGGAIYIQFTTLTEIENSTFTKNFAGSGGAITNVDFSTIGIIKSSTFSENSATAYGGAINNCTSISLGATITSIENSTFSGNSAEENGGAIFNSTGGPYGTVICVFGAITNTTFSGNKLSASATGSGAGIANENAITTITNTFIANSSGGDNCEGSIPAGSNNLDDDGTCNAGWGTITPGTDYNITLADNGGLTKTHALVSGSAAMSSGSACPSTDQRGVARPQGSGCDIGAVEVDDTPPIVSATSLAPSYSSGLSSFTVTFSEAVADDPSGDTDTDDVTNPNNYLVVEKGVNTVTDTTSCAAGVASDDTQATVKSVTYNNASHTATVNFSNTLTTGDYRLFVCGTTSIVDNADNALDSGTDYTFDFTVTVTASSLPETGFRHGRVTQLAEQPPAKAYTATAMTLEIPKLGVSMPIVGVAQSGSEWDVTWLGNNAGYLYGSAFPTWAGNTVITGHVWDAYNQPGAFAELKSLNYGDQMHIQAWGQTYTYEVRESKLVTTKNTDAVFQSEQYDWVTLVTCEFYNPFNGEYLFRRAVRAVLVSVQ